MFSGDSLSYQKDMPFSTRDAEHDPLNGIHCSVSFHGAWWYGYGAWSNLNGQYYNESESYRGVMWHTWKGYESLKAVVMKMRSATFPGQLYHVFILKFCKSNCLYLIKCSALHPPLANLHRPCGISCMLFHRD